MKQIPFMNNDSGFSLVEVVAATFICAIALGGIMFSFRTSLDASRQSENYTIAASLMQHLTEEMRAGIYYPGSETTGQFGDSKFYWNIEFSATDKNDLYLVDLEVSWKDRNRTKRIKNETYLFYEVSEDES